ncbi:SDR family oxidoreductase [Cuniculiplasma sp. SKW3]|uniref:SDR family oxidoreductase n=1 Tax=unclassified Cuniculiplasma TaxID=2619706 RepID=UPI003FD298F5
MNALILGSEGQLGSELRKLMPEAGVIGRENLDISQLNVLKAKLEEVKPDIIFNCAAMTNVDICEREKERAYRVNALAPQQIALYSIESGVRVVHFSTDYVFDGIKGMYGEEDTPNPINYYGLSKLLGDFATKTVKNSLIIRTSGVFGERMNFPRYVYSNLMDGKEVNAIDSFYSPVSAKNLARATLEIVNMGISGLINVAGDRTSRYDLAIKIAEFFGLDSTLVKKTSSLERQTARRPMDSSLDISKARNMLKWDFYSIESNISALKEK